MRINKLSHNINMYMYLQGKAVVPPLPPPPPPLPNLSKNLTSLIQHNYSFDLFWSRVIYQTKYIMHKPWSLVDGAKGSHPSLTY